MKVFEVIVVIFRFIPVLFYFFIVRPYHMYAYYFNRPHYYRAGSAAGNFVLWSLGIKLSVSGKKLLPAAGRGYLIVANHQSYLDIPIIFSVLPTAFIQRSLPYLPGFAWHFGKISLVIRRKHSLSIVKAVRYAKNVTREQGFPVAMFPESTRSVSGHLGKLHLGAATIAKALNLPVLPITICNSRDILPKGKINSKRGTIKVAIQPLIGEDFVKSHSVEKITQEMKSWLQKGLDDFDRTKQASL